MATIKWSTGETYQQSYRKNRLHQAQQQQAQLAQRAQHELAEARQVRAAPVSAAMMKGALAGKNVKEASPVGKAHVF